MIEHGLEVIADLFVWLVDREWRRPKREALVECLRCGHSHTGARCPKCRYVFRVRPSPSK